MTNEAETQDTRPRGCGREPEAHERGDRIAGRTHIGHVRPNNEDGFVCGSSVVAVADGVGGHVAGDVASGLALQPLAALEQRLARGDWPEDPHRALVEAAEEANRRVSDEALRNPSYLGMGTTLTAGLLADGRLYLAHVGDSRAYRWRAADGLRQLTTDHTVVGEAVAAGHMSANEADTHPERSILTRVVGTESEIEVDKPDPADLSPGDRVLLCSDGLIEAINEAGIARCLEADQPADGLAEALIDAALAGEAPDNVTVVVAAV
ncbi:PP2C family protein-serine/threonine phosphatase [Egibacter rhizosphaerae]|nr:protein phosphatase 2C domain-containing protein [Egibacter rhizosphaerae]